MRVPLSKLYRAFRELDRFSDRECERYLLQVRVQLGGAVTVALLLAAGLTFAVFLGCAIPATRWLAAHGRRLRSGVSIDTVEAALAVAVVVGAVLLPAVAGLAMRDRVVRRALRNRIDNARCTRCRFSLLGLPVRNDTVRCPECDTDLSLAALGLKPEELEIGAGAAEQPE